MKLRLTFWTLLTIMLLFSCGTGENQKEFAPLAEEAVGIDKTFNQQGNDKIETSVERKIIKQGEIRFETGNIKETESVILKAVNELSGFVSNDNIYNDNNRITHRMVIRVPADNFDKLIAEISESVEKLDSKSIDALDVTEEYIDVESRIKTKKELENRYKELLIKARAVEEILSIEKEIGTLRTEIESIEGRLQYLKDRVSLSTLTVEFYQKTSSSFNFSSKFGQALVMGWKWLLAFIIGVIHFWPFILVTGVVIFFSFRPGKKRKINKTPTGT